MTKSRFLTSCVALSVLLLVFIVAFTDASPSPARSRSHMQRNTHPSPYMDDDGDDTYDDDGDAGEVYDSFDGDYSDEDDESYSDDDNDNIAYDYNAEDDDTDSEDDGDYSDSDDSYEANDEDYDEDYSTVTRSRSRTLSTRVTYPGVHLPGRWMWYKLNDAYSNWLSRYGVQWPFTNQNDAFYMVEIITYPVWGRYGGWRSRMRDVNVEFVLLGRY